MIFYKIFQIFKLYFLDKPKFLKTTLQLETFRPQICKIPPPQTVNLMKKAFLTSEISSNPFQNSRQTSTTQIQNNFENQPQSNSSILSQLTLMDQNLPNNKNNSTSNSGLIPQFNEFEKKNLNNSFEQILNNVNADQKQINNFTNKTPKIQNNPNFQGSFELEDEKKDSSNAGDIRKMVDPSVKNQIKNSSASDKKNFSLANLLNQNSSPQTETTKSQLQFQQMQPIQSQNGAGQNRVQSSSTEITESGPESAMLANLGNAVDQGKATQTSNGVLFSIPQTTTQISMKMVPIPASEITSMKDFPKGDLVEKKHNWKCRQ